MKDASKRSGLFARQPPSYPKKITVSTNVGPGIPVDPNRTRNLLVDEQA